MKIIEDRIGGGVPLLILGDNRILDTWKWLKLDRRRHRSPRPGVLWWPDRYLAVVRKGSIASDATFYRVECFFGGEVPGRKMMKIAGTSRTWRGVAVLLAAAGLWLAAAAAGAHPLVKQADANDKPKDTAAKPKAATAKPKEDAGAKLRPIRMAIFNVDVPQARTARTSSTSRDAEGWSPGARPSKARPPRNRDAREGRKAADSQGMGVGGPAVTDQLNVIISACRRSRWSIATRSRRSPRNIRSP